MGILYTEGRTDAQASEAERVMHLLTTVYPGHPWAVRVDEGIIFIRHLAFPGNWGMNLRTTEADYDGAVLKKKIVMLAGEWLERAGMRRGRYEDQDIERVEGVPERFQPSAAKEPLHLESVVGTPPGGNPVEDRAVKAENDH